MLSSTLGQTRFDLGEVAAFRLRAFPCFVLLDSSYQIVGAEPRLDAVLKEAGLVERPPYRLPAVIERIVKELVTAAPEDSDAFAEAAVPTLRLLVRSGILLRPSGNYVAVTLGKLRTREPLSGAADRFRVRESFKFSRSL